MMLETSINSIAEREARWMYATRYAGSFVGSLDEGWDDGESAATVPAAGSVMTLVIGSRSRGRAKAPKIMTQPFQNNNKLQSRFDESKGQMRIYFMLKQDAGQEKFIDVLMASVLLDGVRGARWPRKLLTGDRGRRLGLRHDLRYDRRSAHRSL